MIECVEKIEDYGIFLKQGKSPNFTRHTTIYGWNASGKTTLSKLFAELGKVGDVFPLSKYEVVVDGSKVNRLSNSDYAIAVFNEDYVRENAPSVYDVSKSSKHIFSIGKGSKELARKVEEDTKEKDRIDKLINKKSDDGLPSFKDQLKEKRRQYEKIFTDIARTISASGTGVAARNYRSDKAKIAFQDIKEQVNLDSIAVTKLKKRANQETKDVVPEIDTEPIITRLNTIYNRALDIAPKTIIRNVINELEKTQERSDWALSGFKLHEKEGLKDCLLCGNSISKQRWGDLESFFNEEYQSLHTEIIDIRDELRRIYGLITGLTTPPRSLIYQDMHDEYTTVVKGFNEAKNNLLDQIKTCGLQINTKLRSLNSEIKIDSLDFDTFATKLKDLNVVIRAHNSRSKNVDKDKGAAFSALESLYLGSIYDEAAEVGESRDSLRASIETNEAKLDSLRMEISNNQAKIRNSLLGCTEINKALHRMLGRNDLELKDDTSGYNIYRGKELAIGLSEGEKTIITFSYFLASVTIDNDKLKDTIVVIDDPVSSLDIDLIHKIFAAIETRLSKAKQLIIMTHSFEALNHIKKWYFNVSDEEKSSYSLLMIRNDLHDKNRCALIELLDPTLKDHETEYHYIFHRLVKLKNDLQGGGEPNLASVYDYPNLARKAIECYLAFKTPDAKSLSSGLRSLHNSYEKTITSEMITDVNSFINSGSHLDTKTGLLQFDAALTKNIKHYIEATLSIIEISDPLHYKAMIKGAI